MLYYQIPLPTQTMSQETTTDCCCLTIHPIRADNRTDTAQNMCINRIRDACNFYIDYINFPLFHIAKACVPAILILVLFTKPTHGLVYVGLYSYITTIYFIQWLIYECPPLCKNDMYGNYLLNVPAYYYFMTQGYAPITMFINAAFFVLSIIFGWAVMISEAYNSPALLAILLALAFCQAWLKSRTLIYCAITKYKFANNNTPVPLLQPPDHIQTPAGTHSASQTPAPTLSAWNCICCVIKENTPIISIITAVMSVGIICTFILGYFMLPLILLLISMSSSGHHCTNPTVAVFYAVSNALYFTTPCIKYYLHNTDPDNTRFVRIVFEDKNKNDMSGFLINFLYISGTATCFTGLIYAMRCYSHNHVIDGFLFAFVTMCSVMNVSLQVFKLKHDTSTSPLYNEECAAMTAAASPSPGVSEVVNPMTANTIIV